MNRPITYHIPEVFGHKQDLRGTSYVLQVHTYIIILFIMLARRLLFFILVFFVSSYYLARFHQSNYGAKVQTKTKIIPIITLMILKY